MLRLVFLLIIATTSQAMASLDCDAAAARWVEITPTKVEESLGQPMSAAVKEVGNRWGLATSSYIGASLVFENGKQDVETAEALSLTDTLIDCWQPEMESGPAKAQEMVAKFDSLFPPERRSSLRNAAAAIMKSEN